MGRAGMLAWTLKCVTGTCDTEGTWRAAEVWYADNTMDSHLSLLAVITLMGPLVEGTGFTSS